MKIITYFEGKYLNNIDIWHELLLETLMCQISTISKCYCL